MYLLLDKYAFLITFFLIIVSLVKMIQTLRTKSIKNYKNYRFLSSYKFHIIIINFLIFFKWM